MTKNVFDKRDRWGRGIAVWVVAAMAFAAPIAVWSAKQVPLDSDIRTWLPGSDPQAKTLAWFEQHFPAEERILVSWQGSSLNDPRVSRLEQRLEGVPDVDGFRRNGVKHVADVITPHEVTARMAVDRDEAVRRMQGVLIGTGPLKLRLTDAGRQHRDATLRLLTQRAQADFGWKIEVLDAQTEWVPPEGFFDQPQVNPPTAADVASSASTDQAPLPSIPEHDAQIRHAALAADSEVCQRFIEMAKGLTEAPTKQAPDGVPLVADCFFAPGSPVALSIALSEAGRADKFAALLAIRQTAADVGIEPASFHMGGGPVVTALLHHGVADAAWNTDFPIHQIQKRSVMLLSAVVGAVLVFALLRTAKLAALVLLIAHYTVLVAVACLPVFGGAMNLVLVAMPALLLVVTLSAAIHVAGYWRHAAALNVRCAVAEATNMARLPCLLAGVTTALGLLALATSPLAAVREFGIYSAAGCMLAVGVVLIGLPALLQACPIRAPKPSEADQSGWLLLGSFVSKYRRGVMALTLLPLAVGTCGLKWFQTETKAIRYFPTDSQVVGDYGFLEENLSGTVPIDVIVRFDSKTQSTLNFLERLEVVREIENKLREHPEISGALSLASFRPVSPPRPQSQSFLARGPYLKRVNETEKKIKESGSGAAMFLATAHEPSDLVVAGDQLLNKPNDELWRITAQAAILSDVKYEDLTGELNQIAQSVLKFHPGANHVVTGMVPLFLRSQQAVLDGLIRSLVTAFVVSGVVLMIVVRNPLAGMLSTLPNVLTAAAVFGVVSWYGLAVDVATMLPVLMAFGVAIQGTLHLLTRFRGAIVAGRTRRVAVCDALGHCGPAMFQTGVVLTAGLLVLASAEVLPVSRCGWLTAALIGVSLATNVTLTPALLAGPLGALIQRQLFASETRSEPSTESVLPRAHTLHAQQAVVPKPHLIGIGEPVPRPQGRVQR